MNKNTLSAVAAAATFAFLSLGTLAPAQAAPNATLVVHTGGYAHGQPVYQPVYQPGYRPDYRPGHRPHPEAGQRARPGHIWVAGHWQQRGPRAGWQPGHWERSGPAYRPHYGAVNYPNGHYGQNNQFQPPRWDRDGDGVPNRHDRRPNNPYRH